MLLDPSGKPIQSVPTEQSLYDQFKHCQGLSATLVLTNALSGHIVYVMTALVELGALGSDSASFGKALPAWQKSAEMELLLNAWRASRGQALDSDSAQHVPTDEDDAADFARFQSAHRVAVAGGLMPFHSLSYTMAEDPAAPAEGTTPA
jgi:hypothetical protein